jgi:hypothetical protein
VRICYRHFFWDFYFRALRSLVVLSFPQLVSFSSVFPKPLSETLRRSSDGGIPVKLTVSVLTCGAASRGAGRKGPRGTGRDRVWLYVMKEICPRGNNNIVIIIFLVHDMFILHARIVLSGNINTCVVYEQYCVPSMPLLD